jgi:hypothetical protein
MKIFAWNNRWIINLWRNKTRGKQLKYENIIEMEGRKDGWFILVLKTTQKLRFKYWHIKTSSIEQWIFENIKKILGLQSGSSGRAPAQQAWGPEFNPKKVSKKGKKE